MEQKKNWKKKAAVGMVAAATSASVLVGGAFDSPADLLSPDGDEENAPTPIVETLALHTADMTDDGGSDDEDGGNEERSQRTPAVRRLIQSLPLPIRALVGLPLWCAGWAVSTAASLLWQAALTPLGAQILGWVLTAAAALLVYTLTAKAIFPNVPVKKLLRPRNVATVLGGLAALGAADTILSVFWEDYPPISRLLHLVGGALLIGAGCLSARKLLGHREKSDTPSAQDKPSPRTEVEQQAMALADSVCHRPIPRP